VLDAMREFRVELYTSATCYSSGDGGVKGGMVCMSIHSMNDTSYLCTWSLPYGAQRAAAVVPLRTGRRRLQARLTTDVPARC